MFLQVCVCPQGGGGIPACLAGHMTRQQYISRCTVDVSQLVWRQQTGNIKCMMGYVTWYTPREENPLGWRTPHLPRMENPPDGEPPGMENPPPGMETPQMENPPGWRTPLGEPPQMENPPDGEPPQDGDTPPDPENVHFNCNNTFLTCFFKYLHRLMSINVLLT